MLLNNDAIIKILTSINYSKNVRGLSLYFKMKRLMMVLRLTRTMLLDIRYVLDRLFYAKEDFAFVSANGLNPRV